MTRYRYFTASLIAPLAALLVPSLLAIWQLNAKADVMPDGSYDDAGIKSAGLFLFIAAPVLYFTATLYYAAAGHVLKRANRLTRRGVVTLAATAPWSLVALATVGLVMNNRSILPSLLMLAAIGAMMSLFAVAGAFVWWKIAVGNGTSDA